MEESPMAAQFCFCLDDKALVTSARKGTRGQGCCTEGDKYFAQTVCMLCVNDSS